MTCREAWYNGRHVPAFLRTTGTCTCKVPYKVPPVAGSRVRVLLIVGGNVPSNTAAKTQRRYCNVGASLLVTGPKAF